MNFAPFYALYPRNNHVNPVIRNIVNDFGQIFGENK